MPYKITLTLFIIKIVISIAQFIINYLTITIAELSNNDHSLLPLLLIAKYFLVHKICILNITSYKP